MSAGEDRKPLEQIEGTYDALDELQQALDDGRRPEPESDLDADDLDWPQIPVSQVARTGLLSARDHLQAVRIHLDARELFPLAQPTLNRAALIGASQAVFVLHPPERPDRIARARTVAHYEYEQLLKYMRAPLMVVDAEQKVGVIQGIEQVTRRRDQIQTKRSADGQSAAFNTTDMVSYAARPTFPTQPHLVTEAELVWRSTSGSAQDSCGLCWVGAAPNASAIQTTTASPRLKLAAIHKISRTRTSARSTSPATDCCSSGGTERRVLNESSLGPHDAEHQ